jgi:predicted nucleic acid-binding protein
VSFVLDNSVTMRWCFKDGGPASLAYANRVLDSLGKHYALVPSLWHLELVNVLITSEKERVLPSAESAAFINRLDGLPIKTDPVAMSSVRPSIIDLSRRFALTAYDSTYLELAMREHISLATLDSELRKAARKAGVKVHLVE